MHDISTASHDVTSPSLIFFPRQNWKCLQRLDYQNSRSQYEHFYFGQTSACSICSFVRKLIMRWYCLDYRRLRGVTQDWLWSSNYVKEENGEKVEQLMIFNFSELMNSWRKKQKNSWTCDLFGTHDLLRFWLDGLGNEKRNRGRR